MKSLTLLLLLTLAGIGPASSDGPPNDWHSDVAAAQAEARASDRYVLVDLYADWCGWCRKLEREVFSDPAFVEFAEPFVKLRVNVEDGGEGEELQARYQATSLPTLLVLSPRMALAGTVEGYAPRDAYIRRISGVMAGYQRNLESYDQILANGDLEVLEQLAERLHQQGDGARAARAYRQILDDPKAPAAEKARYLYLLADALRLDQDFEGAAKSLRDSKRRAQRAGETGLVEACDLLLIRLARDRGGCDAIIAALEQFLSDHPSSQHHRTARRSLEQLSQGQNSTCT